jgi:hypothetical protein
MFFGNHAITDPSAAIRVQLEMVMIQNNSRSLWFVTSVMLAVLALPFGTRAQERVGNATAGISIVPPSGWHVTSMQEVMNNRSRVRLPDAQLEAGLQRATAPLFVFSKYQEPHATLNPTVQVVLRPRPASLPTSATALLRIATVTLQKAFPDFAFVDPIQDVQVSGMSAAYMKATYTLRTADQREHRILSRTWLVPRGSFMFLIGMSGATGGDDVCQAEFAAALKSIAIDK